MGSYRCIEERYLGRDKLWVTINNAVSPQEAAQSYCELYLTHFVGSSGFKRSQVIIVQPIDKADRYQATFTIDELRGWMLESYKPISSELGKTA